MWNLILHIFLKLVIADLGHYEELSQAHGFNVKKANVAV